MIELLKELVLEGILCVLDFFVMLTGSTDWTEDDEGSMNDGNNRRSD